MGSQWSAMAAPRTGYMTPWDTPRSDEDTTRYPNCRMVPCCCPLPAPRAQRTSAALAPSRPAAIGRRRPKRSEAAPAIAWRRRRKTPVSGGRRVQYVTRSAASAGPTSTTIMVFAHHGKSLGQGVARHREVAGVGCEMEAISRPGRNQPPCKACGRDESTPCQLSHQKWKH